jgi:hypothetical protein
MARFGWLLRNILFALVVPKAFRISSDFILAFPCALVVPKALKNINAVDVFGFYILVTASKQALCAS